MKNYGGLFISDEVQTGFGRTGKKWWGIEQWEVTPDIITSRKAWAMAFPSDQRSPPPNSRTNFKGLTISTFGGNPVTSRRGSRRDRSDRGRKLCARIRYVVGGYFRQS